MIKCRVYWGPHTCQEGYGHRGPHACYCCQCEIHELDHERNGCVAKPPYYGRRTCFYGEDSPLLHRLLRFWGIR